MHQDPERYPLFTPSTAKSTFLYSRDREAKLAYKSRMQIPALAWLVPAHNAAASRGVPGRFTSRVYNYLEHKLLLAVKTFLTDAGHFVSALINDSMLLQDGTKRNNDGMLLQDSTKRNNKQIAPFAHHRTCESICPGINMHLVWTFHGATIKNNAGATFELLRVPPPHICQAHSTLPLLLAPARAPPTSAPALAQPLLLRYTLAGAAQAVVRREHRERGEHKRQSGGRCTHGARMGQRRGC